MSDHELLSDAAKKTNVVDDTAHGIKHAAVSAYGERQGCLHHNKAKDTQEMVTQGMLPSLSLQDHGDSSGNHGTGSTQSNNEVSGTRVGDGDRHPRNIDHHHPRHHHHHHHHGHHSHEDPPTAQADKSKSSDPPDGNADKTKSSDPPAGNAHKYKPSDAPPHTEPTKTSFGVDKNQPPPAEVSSPPQPTRPSPTQERPPVLPSDSVIGSAGDHPPALGDGRVVGVEKMPAGEVVQGLARLTQNPQNLTVAKLTALKDKGIGGFNNIYELPNNRPLTQSELDFIARDFAAARQAGMPLITRFNYLQRDGADASADMIRTHLAQLAPVLHANEDTIGAMELGFVGQWGEWHDSSSGNAKNYSLARDIYNSFSNALPNTPVGFRTVNFVRQLFGENPPNNVILYNDSIGIKSGNSVTQYDAGSFPNQGDYEYTVRHKLMTVGENNRDSDPAEILKRIQDINITSMHFWGPAADKVKSSSYYAQIIAALEANAARDGIPV